MGVMKEFIISTFCWPTFPSVNTDKIPEPANPANIMSMVARGPPIFKTVDCEYSLI